MKKRVITGIVILVVLVPLIVIDHNVYPFIGYAFLGLGIFMSMVASYEMMTMFYTKYPSIGRLRWIIPIFSGTLVYTIYLSTTQSLRFSHPENANIIYHLLTMGLFIIYVIFSLAYIIFTKNSTAKDMMSSILTLTYCGLVMGYVINIRFLEPLSNEQGLIYFRGGRSFGYLYTIVASTDVFAYLIGIKFGRRKLCPDISPKKTVEGAIGGLIAGSGLGVAAAFLLGILHPRSSSEYVFSIIIAFFVSMIISFTVQIGDLVASKLKRTYQIKDFGKIFPGHGGVLDRFDSLIFSGAVYYILVLIIQLFYIWK
jgi:phosphatidate cytidylyltransferase